MERYPAQPGYELVLDARRLIVACALVIFICGVFFVLGFVEGKRQILEATLTDRGAPSAPAAVPAIPKAEPAVAQPPTPLPGTQAPRPAADQQTWYDKVNAPGKQAKQQPQPVTAMKPAGAAAAPPPSKPGSGPGAAAATPSGATTFYACQVGAFRQQKEAQIKAEELKSRGYNPVIDPPAPTGGLYLLKVGRFATRADAVAMQTRLKKAGYNCFIKTTR